MRVRAIYSSVEYVLKKWMMLYWTVDSAEAIKSMFIKEQFLRVCPRNLATHLREKVLGSLDELVAASVRFLDAHNKRFSMPSQYMK